MPTNMRTDTLRALLRSTVGMKAVMATTGAILVAYVVSHVAANLLVFHSPEAINGYGALLHRTGPLLWVARGVLLLAAVLHVTAAVRLTRQARRARPVPYAVYEAQAATLAARTIRWGGVALLLFLLVHIPQMTTGFLHPQFRAGDDYGNVVHVFRVWWVTPLYLAALAALGLHLYHGTWSALRTLGVSGRRAFPLRRPAVATLAALVALGFASIPLAVALGVLSAPPPAVAAAR